jgi:hypothetical protein
VRIECVLKSCRKYCFVRSVIAGNKRNGLKQLADVHYTVFAASACYMHIVCVCTFLLGRTD